MELSKIREHWENLAREHGQDLKATTKAPNAKKLEINALANAIKKTKFGSRLALDILEVGCGNGYNCFGLSKLFPNFNFTGVDYVPQMISNALKTKNSNHYNKINFLVGDILELDSHDKLKEGYDIVFTNRCLINLNTIELQLKAVEQLSKKIVNGGYLFNLENSSKTYNNQNLCRESLGLEKRTPDEYNLFLNEDVFLDFVKEKLRLRLVEINDFLSLHDIILYVLLPKLNGGKIDYSNPLMDIVTELSIAITSKFNNSFGEFGQNRLYLFNKP